MGEAEEIEEAIAEIDGKQVRFARLKAICERFFGAPRTKGSHHIFKTPWPGDPRINIQEDKSGKAKPYQIKQVVAALRRLQKGEES
jgi:hypothetical protein